MVQGRNDDRYRDIKELLDDPLYNQIPSDPQPAEIAEILAKNPALIAYIGNLIVELEQHINNKKLLIKKRKAELDYKKSTIRIDVTKKYKAKLFETLDKEPDVIQNLMDSGYNRIEAKEIAKLRRPDKPRDADLSDSAIKATRDFVTNIIEPLESELSELQKNYDDLKVKHNLFENNFKASQSIKGLLQKDKF